MKIKEKYVYYHNGKPLCEVIIKDDNNPNSKSYELSNEEKLKQLQSMSTLFLSPSQEQKMSKL